MTAPLLETPLGRALRAHREEHGCDGCKEYLEIARAATQTREIWEGPTTAYTRLSIREAARAAC